MMRDVSSTPSIRVATYSITLQPYQHQELTPRQLGLYRIYFFLCWIWNDKSDRSRIFKLTVILLI